MVNTNKLADPPGETVFLLVEDDENDAYLVEREWQRGAPSHIKLKHVPDGVEAVRYLSGEGEYGDRENFPIPNVILLDLKMPRFSGFDFLRWLHRDAVAPLGLIPVLVLSSSTEPEDVARAYALGANTYLIKPLNWRKFQDCVRMLGVYWTEHAVTPDVTRVAPGNGKLAFKDLHE